MTAIQVSRRSTLILAFAVVFPSVAAAQDGARESTAESTARMMFVNDEWERYTRVLQLTSEVPLHPWSIRAFGPRELANLSATSRTHPWATAPRDKERSAWRLSVTVLPANVQTILNSSFAFGYNDGPVWAGRGLTTVLQGGISAKAGPLSVTLSPLLFRAENARFGLRPNGLPGSYAFGDAFRPEAIDQPQRFGVNAYQRLEPGNSTIRLDVAGVAAGFSTANQHWGPARDHPLLLGNNAAGFPHVFLGSSEPVNVWIGKAHGRIFWGKLYETPYTSMREIQPYRFATGLAAVLTPRGIPGLEIGGARFFHVLWSDSVINRANLTRTLTGLLKISRIKASGNEQGTEPDNQLASLFARWVFPKSGLEVYGELAREDHNLNLRDLNSEPDHNSGYLLGLQRAWSRSSAGRRVFRIETVNTRVTSLQIIRGQAPFYVHSPVRQGHTNQGQVLGSFAAFGGGATVVAIDNYSTSGRRTISWSRIMRAESRTRAAGMPAPDEADVFHTLTLDGVARRDKMAITYELTGVYEVNRNFGGNAFNARVATGIQYAW